VTIFKLNGVKDSVMYEPANNELTEVCGHFTACDLFNLSLRPGLIMPQTSDDSLFASSDNGMKIFNEVCRINSLQTTSR